MKKNPFEPDQQKEKIRRRPSQKSRLNRGPKSRWDYYKKDVFVEPASRRLPPWLLPLLIFLVVFGLVFWILPRIASSRRPARTQVSETPQVTAAPQRQDRALICKGVADILDQADLKAARIAQALFNEPAQVLQPDSGSGFTQIRLDDGTTGFVRSDNLTFDLRSVDPSQAQFKVIVRGNSKRIMSHASRGVLVLEVAMGTVLYADYQSENLLHIRLPDDTSGWITKEHVLMLDATAELAVPENAAELFCSSAMAFDQATWIPHGLTRNGISLEGAIRIAAGINGVSLPRQIDNQVAQGQAVELPLDPATEKPMTHLLRPGDLVFFHTAADRNKLDRAAIVMLDGRLLMARVNRQTIGLVDLTIESDWLDRIAAVRRIFDS